MCLLFRFVIGRASWPIAYMMSYISTCAMYMSDPTIPCYLRVSSSLKSVVVRHFPAVSRCISRLAVRHPEPFNDRFAVCLLGNSHSTCLAIPLDFHSEYERCFPHVGHFEALLQIPFHHRNGVKVVAGQEMVIDVVNQVDLGPVVTVQIHARV